MEEPWIRGHVCWGNRWDQAGLVEGVRPGAWALISQLLLFSHLVMSDSLWPRGLQHARLPCPSLSPGVCSNSCPLSWWCHPTISSAASLFSFCPQSFPASRPFSNKLALCIRWQRYWNFSFSISPSNEHSGKMSFSIDWFNFLVVQGTLKSLLQHHSLKASILRHSTFFTVLSHPYMTTGKTIALTIQTFVSKVMSLLFNMLFNPWVGKIPWRRERLPTLVFWPGEFHGVTKSRIDWATFTSLH